MLVGLLALGASCQPKKKSYESLEKETRTLPGSLKIVTKAEMTVQEIFEMANHHSISLDRLSHVRYRISGTTDVNGLSVLLDEKEYIKKESYKMIKSDQEFALTLAFLNMNQHNQRDWQETVSQWQLEEQPNEKTFYTDVTEGQEINYLKKLAQNPQIKWEEPDYISSSEEHETPSLFFVSEQGATIR